MVLRLDDGTVVGAAETLGVTDASTPAVALDPDKAFAAGRLAPQAVTKLEELLRNFAEKFPTRHLRTVDLKRRASDAFGEVGDARVACRCPGTGRGGQDSGTGLLGDAPPLLSCGLSKRVALRPKRQGLSAHLPARSGVARCCDPRAGYYCTWPRSATP